MMDLVKKYKEVPETMVRGIVCPYFVKPFNKRTSGEIDNDDQIYTIV